MNGAAFALRALDYLALALAIGVPVFALRVWAPAVAGLSRSEHDAAAVAGRRLRGLALGACGLGAVAALGLAALEANGSSRLALVLRAAAFAVLGLALARAFRPHDAGAPASSRQPLGPWTAPAGAAGAALVILPGAGGHAGADSLSPLLLPLDAIHVSAMAVWIGGLAALLTATAATRAGLASDARTRLLAAVLLAFSPLALTCVAALVVTGVIQGLIQVPTLRDLVDTGYGRDLLAKVLLLGGAVALAAWSRERGAGRLQAVTTGGEASVAERVVRRALGAEFLLLIVVLGVVSALVATTPP